MRKQLLACAVLAVTMVPSLAGAALISITVNEGAGALPGAADPQCSLVATACQINVATTNFTSNITGVSQLQGNTSVLLLANDITAFECGEHRCSHPQHMGHGVGFDGSDRQPAGRD